MKILVFLCFLFYTANSFAQSFLGRGPRKNLKLEIQGRQAPVQVNPNTYTYQNVEGELSANLFKSDRHQGVISYSGEQYKTNLANTEQERLYLNSADLYNHEVSLNYTYNFQEKGAAFSLSGSFGSASDRPFENSKNSTVNLNALYRTAFQKNHQWIFFLNFSNNRTFLNNVPLPSVGYLYKPHKKFIGFFGLPILSLTWIDFPNYFHRIFITPSQLDASLSWGVYGPISLYTKFYTGARSFIPSQSEINEIRALLTETQLEAGVKMPFSRSVSAKIGGGYAFKRKLYTGEGVFDKSFVASLKDSPYINLRLTINL